LLLNPVNNTFKDISGLLVRLL